MYKFILLFFVILSGHSILFAQSEVDKMLKDITGKVDEIVIKCIRKVREDRYQSIDQILEDIKNLSKAKKESEPAKG